MEGIVKYSTNKKSKNKSKKVKVEDKKKCKK